MKAECVEPGCATLSYGNGKCKSHYMKDYRQAIKSEDYIRIRGEGEPVTRRDYVNIDPDDLWNFVKKELKIG